MREALEKKVVLITGSSRGIGKAIALRLAREGAQIIINASKSKAEAKKTLSELPKKKEQKHTFIRSDIRDLKEIGSMMEEIRRRYGRLDILVNNAGITQFIEHKNLTALSSRVFDDIYRVHVRGAFLCTQKALPLLKKSKEAMVVNIASIAALTAVGSNIAYCAMKAALLNMTKALARALAPEVRVNSISPGLTETNLVKGWEEYKKEQMMKTPLKRLGTGEDIANTVFSLATSLTYVTGENIVVDGGRSLE